MNTITLDKENNAIIIIDQTKLPGSVEYLNVNTPADIFDAIYNLKVRGAPAIGVMAAFGMYVISNDIKADNFDDFFKDFKIFKEYLASSRPTAHNLFDALDEMESCALENKERPLEHVRNELYIKALEIQREDIDSCKRIGEYGLSLLRKGDGILTHCNAGALATSKYGTATSPIYLGQERGYGFKVYADETRPLLQGARLTAYELFNAGVDVTLICDNMISSVMRKGWIDAVFTGCDCIAANGDTANKIGTSVVAITAQKYGIPFYVCAPMSSINLNIKTGNDIVIEERDGDEITHLWYEKPMAPQGIKTYNPAFDITDHELITAVITDKGIIKF